jgi:lipopolysaccharide biosynthesis protein
MAEPKKETWSDIKNVLAEQEKKELIRLIGDLYRLNTANKTFLHTRYPTGEVSLEPYKKIISDALNPPFPGGRRKVNFSAGKRAISAYYKATNDTVGKIKLMVHYVEMGTTFTVRYGDMWESFYVSLERMFEMITEELDSQPDDCVDHFLPELERIVDMASNMGWGYYDDLTITLYDFCDRNGRELSSTED